MSVNDSHDPARSVERLALSNLVEICRQQRASYYHRPDQVDSRFCFELFRRAFAEQNDEALTALYPLYLPQVAAWVQQLARETELDYPLGFYVADCASHFVLKMRARHFRLFQSLGQIMAFWKKCIFGLMIDSMRRRRFVYVSIDELPLWAERQEVHTGLIVEWLVARLNHLLISEKDQLLIELALYHDWKPREIAAHYPQHWPSPGAVSTAISRLKTRLKDDPAIQQLGLK